MSMNGLIDLLSELMSAEPESDEEKNGIFRLKNMIIESVHLVDRGANKRTFAVRKRGEDMQIDGVGLEVVENSDGSFSTQEKADTIPKAVKDAVVKLLTEASERTLSLINRVKQAKEGEGGLASDFLAECKNIGTVIAQVYEKYPSPTPKKKSEDEELEKACGDKKDEKKSDEQQNAEKAFKKPPEVVDEEEMKKAKAKQQEDELMKAAAGDPEDEATKSAKAKLDELEKAKGKPALCPVCGKEPCVCEEKSAQKAQQKPEEDEVQKSGAKMAKTRLERFKEAIKILSDVAKELEPAERSELLSMLNIKKSEATIPDGQTAPSESKVQKTEKRTNWGINLNNKQLHRETADKDTSFFE